MEHTYTYDKYGDIMYIYLETMTGNHHSLYEFYNNPELVFNKELIQFIINNKYSNNYSLISDKLDEFGKLIGIDDIIKRAEVHTINKDYIKSGKFKFILKENKWVVDYLLETQEYYIPIEKSANLRC
jgi:hypothetical protein